MRREEFEIVDIHVKREINAILDKIKTKIMQLDCDIEDIYYDSYDVAMSDVVHTVCREEVLQIIDNYKSEVLQIIEHYKKSEEK